MTAIDDIKQGTATFLENPVLIVLALAGATINVWIAARIEAALTSFSLASLLWLPYLIYGSIFVSITTIALLISWIDTQKTGADRRPVLYAFRRLPSIFIAASIYITVVASGLLVFILPGIYLAVRLVFFPFFAISECQSMFTALGSSWDTTSGRFWATALPLAAVWLVGSFSGTVMELLPAATLPAFGLIHTVFVLPWSVAVIYATYRGID